MTIRPEARRWLESNHSSIKGPIYSTKFYEPAKSWTKRSAWWLEIPINQIEDRAATNIHLLCQVAPKSMHFHYLKVPTKFFAEQLQKFSVLKNSKISLFLSAEKENMFIDERGTGKVGFSKFIVLP